MRSAFKSFLITAILFCSIAQVSAFHLLGGSISYRYLGIYFDVQQNKVLNKYEITVEMYRDCGVSGSGVATSFDTAISVGVYENASGNKLYKTVWMRNPVESSATPRFGGSKCSFKPDVCIKKGVYSATIGLPDNNNGYILDYRRCCRSSSLVNVEQNMGQTYYGIIPPTYYENTSPYFTDVPVPYICAGDTVRMINAAAEPDGDSLVYEMAYPFQGGDQNRPVPGVSPSYSPPDNIYYNSGFSYTSPFGSGGYASIDPHSGITTVYCPSTGIGRYVIAYDVSEYRNGKKISKIRRDIQIFVLSCPPSSPPSRIDPPGDIARTSYKINAGDKLTIPFVYTDQDSIYTFFSGELFTTSSGINPLATVSNTEGQFKLTTNFEWQTTCKLGRANPYHFTAKATNNACPSKSLVQDITVFVVPFKGADKITGDNPACSGKRLSYSANKTDPSSTLYWSVSGGSIISGTKDNPVTIVWDRKATQGVIKLVEVSKFKCVGDTVTFPVKLIPSPDPPQILGPDKVCITKTYEYGIFNKYGYKWIVKGGTFTTGSSGQNSIDVTWSAPDSGKIFAVAIDVNGCTSDTAEYKVVVSTPKIDSIYGPSSVCPNAKAIDYWVNLQKGSSVYWKVIGGEQVSGGNTSHIQVDWGQKGQGLVQAVEITSLGCVGDTVSLNVIKDYTLFTSAIRGDTSLCEFTKGVPYEVTFSNGSTYEWKISGGTIVSGNGGPKVFVDWDKAGKGLLKVTETAYDPINGRQCQGAPVSLFVTIHPVPNTSSIIGPLEVCQFDSAIYSVKGFKNSRFTWTFSGQPGDTLSETGDSVRLFMSKPGTFKITVTEMSVDSCTGPTRLVTVIVHPQPVTSDIIGPQTVCFPHLNGVVYKVKGYKTSSYKWEIEGGSIVDGDGTDSITVNWNVAGVREVSVREVSQYGCLGTPKKIAVNVDSLFIRLEVVTTGRQDERQIELYWTTKNRQFLNTYIHIYRSQGKTNYLVMIDSVPASQTYYIDKRVSTDKYPYYYQVEAINSCGTPIRSEVHKSILNQGSLVNDTTVGIHWNAYEGWPESVDYYYVYRSLNDDTTLHFFALTKDTSMQIPAGLDGYLQCYRVAAIKAQDNSVISWSNTKCFEFEPYLWIPNAFTPNVDRLNDSFKPLVANYRTYDCTIYNRWGERIFHSTDPNINWDGTFKGKDCPMDVYLYFINVEGRKKNLHKSGTVHLLR